MKSRIFFLSAALAVFGFPAWTPPALAQATGNAPVSRPTEPGLGQATAAKPTDSRLAQTTAKTLAKTSVQAAEEVLTRNNRAQANTAEWHLETSQKLVEVAQALAREGSRTAIPALATQSLQHLDRVATISAEPRVKAQAKASAAMIQERIVGDPTAAIASYKAAVQLDPNDAGTKEALARLEAADANLRARIRPSKKKK